MPATATLNNGTTTINLPRQLSWTDEFSWTSIVQQREYTITGALIIDDWQKQAGRPITLSGGESEVWILKSDLEVLQAWANVAGLEMTLTLPDSRTYQVMFDQSAPIQANPIWPNPAYRFPYSLTLKFFQID